MIQETTTPLIYALQHVYTLANYLANIGFSVAIIRQDETDADADFIYHTQLSPTHAHEIGQQLTLDQRNEIRRFENACSTYRREAIEYEVRCKEIRDYHNPDFNCESNAAAYLRRKVLTHA